MSTSLKTYLARADVLPAVNAGSIDSARLLNGVKFMSTTDSDLLIGHAPTSASDTIPPLSYLPKASPIKRPSNSSDRKICNDQDSILPGVWERTHLSQQSFHCCEYDECDGSELSPCKPSRCDGKSEGRMIHAREKYIWKPDSCDLIAWNSTQFCGLLGNRTMLLIGDSTMHQSAITLTSMISYWYEQHNADAGISASCADQILFRWSDFLIVSHDVPVEGATNFYPGSDQERGASISEHILEVNPDIVVITAGAHFMSEVVFTDTLQKIIVDAENMLRFRHEARGKATTEGDEKLSHIMQRVSDVSNSDRVVSSIGQDRTDHSNEDYLLGRRGLDVEQERDTLNSKKHIQFIWKSQNPAHLSCVTELQPFDDFNSAIRNAEVEQPLIDKYFWHMHPKFDRIAARLFKDSQQPFKFLDMRPLYMRPDGHHGDVSLFDECLHYCLPGPLNLFAVQLLHLLQHHSFQVSVAY